MFSVNVSVGVSCRCTGGMWFYTLVSVCPLLFINPLLVVAVSVYYVKELVLRRVFGSDGKELGSIKSLHFQAVGHVHNFMLYPCDLDRPNSFSLVLSVYTHKVARL